MDATTTLFVNIAGWTGRNNMKNALTLWALFLVTGSFHVHYPHSQGLATLRVIHDYVYANNKAQAVNTVLFALKSDTRKGFIISDVEEIKDGGKQK